MPRFHCPLPLAAGATLDLPAGAARHVQVLRLQPGAAITLFNGEGGEWAAQVLRMGRSEVQVQVGTHHAVEREAARAVHLIASVIASDRMDWLVEKATELGAARITPVLAERSVLRLAGERADKKRAHWQAVAVAACEQSGRNRVPPVDAVCSLAQALAGAAPGAQPLLLSLQPGAQPLAGWAGASGAPATLLCGPEGGWTAAEERAALAQGAQPITLGTRVLRAETAPLAALALLAG